MRQAKENGEATCSSGQVFGRETWVRAASAGAGETGKERKEGGMMPAGQTVPDRVEYYYQAVSTGAEAGERLAHSRKCEMTQELNEQEEVERGALRGGRPLASQAQRMRSAVQNGRSVDRRAVRVGGSAAVSREGCVTGDRHASSLRERAKLGAL